MRSLVVFSLGLGVLACTNPRLDVPDLDYKLSTHWPSTTHYPGVGDGRIILTNNQDDTLSIFDLGALGQPGFRELTRVPVGLNPIVIEGPHEASIDSKAGFYYVNITNAVAGAGAGPRGASGTGLDKGFVAKYRASDNELVAAAEVDPSPGNSAVSHDSKHVYVSHYNFATIIKAASQGLGEDAMATRFLSLRTGDMSLEDSVPLCPGAHGVRLSPDGTRAYVTCIADKIAVVDLAGPKLSAQYVPLADDPGDVIVPKYEPYGIAVSPVTGEVWASCRGIQQLRVIDPHSLTVDMSRVVGLIGQPLFGDFNADGSLFYVATQLEDSVTVVDTASGTVLRQIPFPPGACSSVHQFRFSPDYHYGLVACEGDHGAIPGSLVVFDMTAGESFVTSVPVGIFPDFVGVVEAP